MQTTYRILFVEYLDRLVDVEDRRVVVDEIQGLVLPSTSVGTTTHLIPLPAYLEGEE